MAQRLAPHPVAGRDVEDVAGIGRVAEDFRKLAMTTGKQDRQIQNQERRDADREAGHIGDRDAPLGRRLPEKREASRCAEHQRMQHGEQQNKEREEPRGLERREEDEAVEQPRRRRQGDDPHALPVVLPGGEDEVAQERQQHRAIGLRVNHLHRVHVGEGEQKGADRGPRHREAEMAPRETDESEEADDGEHRHHDHERREHVEAERPQRREHDPIEKHRVGESERPAFGIEEVRVRPVRRAQEHAVPVLDDGDNDLAVGIVAENAVEAGEQPAPEKPRKAYREQNRGEEVVELDAGWCHFSDPTL